MTMKRSIPCKRIISPLLTQQPTATFGWSPITNTYSRLQLVSTRRRIACSMHACRVKTILEEIDPKGDDILVLAQEEGNRVWLEWVIPNLKKKKKGGTLESYLTSLQKFLKCATKKGKHPHLPVIDADIKDMLQDLAVGLKGWRHFITKESFTSIWTSVTPF